MSDNGRQETLEANIKPMVTTEEVKTLLQKLYGLKGGSINQLQGFDDLNYFSLPSVCTNKFLSPWPHGYVLKVMNSLDSRNDALCEGQNALMIFLRENGIPCPTPVKTVDGRLYVKEWFPSAPVAGTPQKEHIIRLLEFQKGVLLLDAPKSYSLFYQVGIFVAKLNEVLKNYNNGRDIMKLYCSCIFNLAGPNQLDWAYEFIQGDPRKAVETKFSHPVYQSHYSIWHLKSVPDIKPAIQIIESAKRKELTETVTDIFTKDALRRAATFEEVMIHGDLNENNILMAKDDSGEWRVSAILDFGDSHRSCCLFEVAISLCYMMLECKRHGLDPVVGAGHFLAGYLTIRPNFPLDCSLLKLCICARLCQSLVLGLKAYTLQPENKYVLGTQDLGWILLEELWQISDEGVAAEWEAVFHYYNIKHRNKSVYS